MKTANLAPFMVMLVLLSGAVLSAQTTTLSQSTNPNLIAPGNSVACGNVFGQGENRYFRVYTAPAPIMVTAIRFGVELDTDAPSTLSLRLWNVAGTTATTFTMGTQIGATTTFPTPGNGTWNQTVRTISLNAPIQLPSGVFAVEVAQATNQAVLGNFFFGSNSGGESAVSYLMAPLCAVNTPTSVGTLVAGAIHYVLDVIGYQAPVLAPDPEIDVRFPAGPRNTVAVNGTINVGPLPAGVASNVQVEIANQGWATSLVLNTPLATAPVNCAVAPMVAPAPIPIGAQSLLTIAITPVAGVGTWSFSLAIPNTDASEGNYTLTVQGTRGLSGVYTVGTGQTYADPGLAFNDLEQFGVAGAVTLSISAGTYAPNPNYGLGINGVVLAPVRGLSATNTLTIARATAAAQVTIGGAATVDPFGLITGCMSIHGCSFVTVDGLTFRDGVGFGLWMGHDSSVTGRASNLTIRNCKATSIANGPGIAVYNESRPLDNVLIQNCMVWECAGGNTLYAMELAGNIAVFMPGLNTVIEHCTVVNSTGTTAANLGRPGAIGYNSPAVFEPVRTSPTIRNCVLVADGTNRPCIWFPNDDPVFVVTAGPYAPTAANRNVYFVLNGGQVGTSALTGTVTQNFATLAAWRAAFPALDVNSVDTNPNLAGAVDLHIGSTSSAIDLAAGSVVATDIDGDARPQGPAPDAGADEFFPGPGLSVIATDPNAAEATPAIETGTYTLTFVTPVTAPVTINFAMSGIASSVPGTDYNLTSPTPGAVLAFTGPGGTITVPAATTTVSLVLTPVDDIISDGTEPATFTINPGNGYTVGAPAAANVTITDNDAPPVPVVTVTSAGTPGEAGGVQGTFTLTAVPLPPAPINVVFSLTGAATLNTDYISTSSTSVQIPVTGTATVTITPIDDALIELNGEAVILTVNGAAGYIVGSPNSALLTIVDDDFPVISVVSSGSPSEAGVVTGTFTLTATPAPPAPLPVNLIYGGTAVQGADYTTSHAASVIIPVSGTANVTITPIDDLTIEATGDDVTLTIDVGANYIVGAPAQASLTITDNDFPPVNIVATSPTHALADGTFNILYSANVTANGGDGTFTWSVAVGSALPGGLSLANAGQATAQVSGTPTVAGNFTFTLECTDGLTTDSQIYTVFLATGTITPGSGGGGGGGGGGCAAEPAGLLTSVALLMLGGLAIRRRRLA